LTHLLCSNKCQNINTEKKGHTYSKIKQMFLRSKIKEKHKVVGGAGVTGCLG
jgi:hypothetical protein